MLHLSTQDVVLSIENTKIQEENSHVYQHYHSFFGNTNTFDLDFDDVIFDQLETKNRFPGRECRTMNFSQNSYTSFS